MWESISITLIELAISTHSDNSSYSDSFKEPFSDEAQDNWWIYSRSSLMMHAHLVKNKINSIFNRP